MRRVITPALCMMLMMVACKPRGKQAPEHKAAPATTAAADRPAAPAKDPASSDAVVEPIATRPGNPETVTTQPADSQPATTQPGPAVPADTQPADTQPAEVYNDYYKNPEARQVLTAVVDAYGGEARLRALTKIKTVTKITFRDIESLITSYEVPGKFRMDISRDDKRLVQAHDGDSYWIGTDETMQAPPEIMAFLRRETIDGIWQQSLLSIGLDKNRLTRYHGKEAFPGVPDSEPCWKVETLDTRGRKVELYYDPQTYLLRGKVTTDVIFKESEVIKSHAEFQGIKYPSSIELLNNSGVPFGTMEVLEVTTDFDDGVFSSDQPGLMEEEP